MTTVSFDDLSERREPFSTDKSKGYQDLVQLEGVVLGEGKQTTPKDPWSDGIFYEKYVEEFVQDPQPRPGPARLYDIYLAFLNYYTNGTLSPGNQGSDLVNAVLYNLLLEGDLVFDIFMTEEEDNDLPYGVRALKEIAPKWCMMATSVDRETHLYEFSDAVAFYRETCLVSTKNCNTWPVAWVFNGNCLVEFSAYNIPKLSLIFALIANDEKTWPEVFSKINPGLQRLGRRIGPGCKRGQEHSLFLQTNIRRCENNSKEGRRTTKETG